MQLSDFPGEGYSTAGATSKSPTSHYPSLENGPFHQQGFKLHHTTTALRARTPKGRKQVHVRHRLSLKTQQKLPSNISRNTADSRQRKI